MGKSRGNAFPRFRDPGKENGGVVQSIHEFGYIKVLVVPLPAGVRSAINVAFITKYYDIHLNAVRKYVIAYSLETNKLYTMQI